MSRKSWRQLKPGQWLHNYLPIEFSHDDGEGEKWGRQINLAGHKPCPPVLVPAGTLWHVAGVDSEGALLYSLAVTEEDTGVWLKLRNPSWSVAFERARKPRKNTPENEAWSELEILIDRDLITKGSDL